MKNKIHVPALRFSQNNFIFYSAVITSNILKETCFVSRREDDPKKGFQRLLNESRASAIRKYLDNKEGAIPTAIILSAQEESRMKYDEKRLKLSFVKSNKSFLVLDGQHRLYGLNESKKIYQIPVIIFRKLGLASEVKYFIDINSTQRGVPTALILDIKQLAGTETSIEERLRRVFDAINKDAKSPLIGLMSPSRSKAGQISRVVFNEKLKPIIDRNGILNKTPNDLTEKAIVNYLRASEKILTNSKATYAKLNKSLFFQAFFEIFEDIARRALEKYGNLKEESFLKEMEPLSKVEFDKHKGSSKVTISNLVREMNSQFIGNKTITNEMV